MKPPATLTFDQLLCLEREYSLKVGKDTPYAAEVWIGQQCIDERGTSTLILVALFDQDEFNLANGNHLIALVTINPKHDAPFDVETKLKHRAERWHEEFVEMLQGVQVSHSA
ncbi:MAG: hypothetical protein KF716_08685 [Anaerolineae bacterium]|nr:hypothetical protein [Anaerolineae bacterium]